MNGIAGPLGVVVGVCLAVASWYVANDYAPAVSAFLLIME